MRRQSAPLAYWFGTQINMQVRVCGTHFQHFGTVKIVICKKFKPLFIVLLSGNFFIIMLKMLCTSFDVRDTTVYYRAQSSLIIPVKGVIFSSIRFFVLRLLPACCDFRGYFLSTLPSLINLERVYYVIRTNEVWGGHNVLNENIPDEKIILRTRILRQITKKALHFSKNS